MLISYLALSVVMGMFFAFWWSSGGALNSLIKVFFTLYTIAGVIALLSQFNMLIPGTAMRLF